MSHQHKSNRISESFKERADSSAYWEAWVGARLSRANLFTVHHPFTLASETGNPLSFYAHTWDLDVSADNVLFTPVEVKSVNLRFANPNDYPHMGVLVCSEASFRNKAGPTRRHLTSTFRDFLMVSRITGDILWLPKGTPVGRKEVTDKTRGETYWCITAHKSELRPLDAFVESVRLHGQDVPKEDSKAQRR